jgi:2-polyprenyl-6-methoxyphenol hydroxylase-like FAD-dependent oxidoreductase
MAYDFLIVGGGIGGAVLANLLARQGKAVVVVERNPGPSNRIRPEILWPATVERLRSLLPLEVEARWGLGLKSLNVRSARRILAHLPAERLGITPCSTNPNQTRELLLQQDGFELRRGMELVRLLREDARYRGAAVRDVTTGREEEIAATWTIGDDGGNSVVRRECQIELKALQFPVEIMTFAFTWPATLPPATAHVWLHANPRQTGLGVMGMIALPEERGMALIVGSPRAFTDGVALGDAVGAAISWHEAWSEVLSQVRLPDQGHHVRIFWGHAARYGVPGALILGDAVHPVSPAGGQGANLSVADAWAIAELVAQGRDGTDLIAAYERQRRPAAARSLRFTRSTAQLFRLPAWLLRWLARLGLPLAGRWPGLVRPFIGKATTAFLSDAQDMAPVRL